MWVSDRNKNTLWLWLLSANGSSTLGCFVSISWPFPDFCGLISHWLAVAECSITGCVGWNRDGKKAASDGGLVVEAVMTRSAGEGRESAFLFQGWAHASSVSAGMDNVLMSRVNTVHCFPSHISDTYPNLTFSPDIITYPLNPAVLRARWKVHSSSDLSERFEWSGGTGYALCHMGCRLKTLSHSFTC